MKIGDWLLGTTTNNKQTHATVQDIINKHMPTVKEIVKHSLEPKWIKNEINAPHNHAEHRTWRSRVVKLIRAAKRCHTNATAPNQRNPPVLWRHMKGLCPSKMLQAPSMIAIGHEIVTDTKKLQMI